ncbi:MAG: hypothetical protein ACRCX2_27160 [Paraclostridium sp.]
MLEVWTISSCHTCQEFIKMLEFNNVEFKEVKEHKEIHKYLAKSNLPFLFKDGVLLDRGKFIMELGVI